MNNENQANKSLNEHKGFCLFNDVEDQELRTRNRAVVMTNIAENHTKNKLITPGGAGILIGYFNAIPQDERKGVFSQFMEKMYERGFVLTH